MVELESAVDIAAAVRSREVSALEMAERALARVAERDGPVNSCIEVLGEDAPADARQVDAGRLRAGPLAGVPVAIKEILAMRGHRSTWGCPGMRGVAPAERDDPYVARLRAAGAVIVARTNVPELSCWGHTENPLYGETLNPWNLSRAAGGSSGGSAAAVSLGVVPLALGSDAGGSVRVPASFTGVVGLKPSFVTAPADDAAFVSRLNCVGPLSASVGDAALCLDVLASGARAGQPPVAKIGTTVDYGFAPVDQEVRDGFESALDQIRAAGLTPAQADPPPVSPLPFIVPMLECEVYEAFADVLAGDHGLSAETVAVAEIGKTTTGREYVQALLERHRFEERWRAFFEDWDVLLAPTTQVVAFERGVHGPDSIDGHAIDPAADGAWYPTSFIANVLGAPAVSVPTGLTGDGLPQAVQVLGRPGDDRKVLEVAARIEAAVGRMPAPPAASAEA